ncbi:Panacea domain-containing protein [Alloscardovia sp. HMSC034E08]|uniref:Panacea domain-containing protein n=1 Tax=Alloscardovia sp. HMSC034E08 TaxID=1739413 RepID=UPI001FED71B8|nr:type II toxin-antitoxin system antitoxin SocA domain-containing protein [Alloscardovia sp. HMSC034E08]
MMISVANVAAYILEKSKPMTTMKLQKLVYYVQAMSLCRTGKPLIDTEFYAWINGSVSRELFNLHKGLFMIRRRDLQGVNPDEHIDEASKEIIDEVLIILGNETGNSLSERTHNEKPWIDARAGLRANQLGTTPITNQAMMQYYSANPIQS